MHNSRFWIENLKLESHPEGGYFRETYRAAGTIPATALPPTFGGDRSFATSIYFLLEAGQFSTLHRISSDEGWHFYDGDPLTVYVIHPDGRSEEIRLGREPEAGQVLQAVVPGGSWFGAKVQEGGSYSLVGCTVAPGFDFEDFEMAERGSLLEEFPGHKAWIEMLTHP